ncbi:MAG: GWxTD domain-containing protein [Gemmatimonadetes bacterium]|nr:GWxTD domain-containing protein [Gemmatimonadota bacterium]
MRRAAFLPLVLVPLWTLGCGPWQRVGSEDRPQSGTTLPRLFDAVSVYRSMGFWVTGAPLPFVASVRYLAGGVSDSTLAIFALSLANHAIGFRRDGNEFVARYHVEVAFRGDTGTPLQIARDETVRVRSFQETLRADESVIFQQVLRVPPGVYMVSVLMRDRNGPALGRTERVDTVPRFAGPALAEPIAFYEGAGRTARAEPPRLVTNPRATLPYGGDSLRFYIEGYDLPPGAPLAAQITDGAGGVLWHDTVAFGGDQALSYVVLAVGPDHLPVGQAQLDVTAAGTRLTGHMPLLVSFSNQWVITNFSDIVSLLRYFDRQDLVGKLREVPVDQRPVVWREFWLATDPVPLTPENEALDDYFRRVQQANLRFQAEGDAGWLTDRGEVFITLGEPDDVLDLSSGLDRSGIRAIRWTYNSLRLTLVFQDQTGFGRFRLTPLSRAEYVRVLARVRRAQ